MRKILCMLFTMAMIVSVVPINAYAADNYGKLTSDEIKLFKENVTLGSNSTLKDVSVSYSSELAGKNNINNYHWTVWRNNSKGMGINKAANSGAGIGSGNYGGFSSSKVDLWSQGDKYVNAIKQLNNGKFPVRQNYSYPVDTNTNKLGMWVDRAGYYTFLCDPQYDKLTLNGYANFKWTEEIKETKETVQNTVTNLYEGPKAKEFAQWTAGNIGFADGIANWMINAPFPPVKQMDFATIKNVFGKAIENQLIASKTYNYNKTRYTMSYYGEMKDRNNENINYIINIHINGDVEEDSYDSPSFPDTVVCKYSTVIITNSYKTETHTKKVQIASTVIAEDTYATQLASYYSFYLAKKSDVSTNKIKTGYGFWGNTKAYYINGTQYTHDVGNYNYTFTNQTSGGKLYSNIMLLIPESYTLFEDIPNTYSYIPNDVKNPTDNSTGNSGTGSGGNNGGTSGGGGSGDTSNPDDNPGGTTPDGNKPDGNIPGDGNNGDNGNNGNGGNGGNNGDNGNNNNNGNGGGNHGGNGNNNGGQSSNTNIDNPYKFGNLDNQPLVYIDLDAVEGVKKTRLPKRVVLYDIHTGETYK